MNVTILTALQGKFKKAYLPKQKNALEIQIKSMEELGVEFELSEFPLYERAKKIKQDKKVKEKSKV